MPIVKKPTKASVKVALKMNGVGQNLSTAQKAKVKKIAVAKLKPSKAKAKATKKK